MDTSMRRQSHRDKNVSSMPSMGLQLKTRKLSRQREGPKNNTIHRYRIQERTELKKNKTKLNIDGYRVRRHKTNNLFELSECCICRKEKLKKHFVVRLHYRKYTTDKMSRVCFNNLVWSKHIFHAFFIIHRNS